MAGSDTDLIAPQTPLTALGARTARAARFRPISNPATGERIQFTTVPEDGEEDLVRFNWHSMPGGAIPEHLHRYQEKRFIIAAGEAHFTLDGEERVAGAGETIVVPVGVRHSEQNRRSVEIEAWSSFAPDCTPGKWASVD
jgi:quercetin dioxygenase-like cupin family protein